MPSQEQMEQDVQEVLAFCRRYRGIHEDTFTALRERLSDASGDTDGSEAQERHRLEDMYKDAISTLLLLADPPGPEAYREVISRIESITDIAMPKRLGHELDIFCGDEQ